MLLHFVQGCLVLLVWYTTASGQHCNKVDDDDRGTVLSCLGLSGIEALDQELKSHRSTDYLDEFELDGLTNVPCFNMETFKEIEADSVTLRNIMLPFWIAPVKRHGDWLGNLEPVRLTLRNVVGINNWNWAEMSTLIGKNVQEFTVSNSRWVRLTSDLSKFFEDTGVSTVIFNNCSIYWLEGESLHCPKCKSISLNGNQIQSLSKYTFGSVSPDLNHLDLSWNLLRSLDADVFEKFDPVGGMTKKIDLILTGNPLRELLKETFDLFKKQKIEVNIILEESRGQFKCECKYEWLNDNQVFFIGSVKCFNSLKDQDEKLSTFLTSCENER